MSLTPNVLAFIGLSNEYCEALERVNVSEGSKEDFLSRMLRLLPRIYISATDLPDSDIPEYDRYLNEALEEDIYNNVQAGVAALLGEDDTFLEVFEEDMKYSETPIAASVSELLSDIFQVLYNFLDTVRDAPEEVVETAVVTVKEEFKSYWSATLCNVLRAINRLVYY